MAARPPHDGRPQFARAGRPLVVQRGGHDRSRRRPRRRLDWGTPLDVTADLRGPRPSTSCAHDRPARMARPRTARAGPADPRTPRPRTAPSRSEPVTPTVRVAIDPLRVGPVASRSRPGRGTCSSGCRCSASSGPVPLGAAGRPGSSLDPADRRSSATRSDDRHAGLRCVRSSSRGRSTRAGPGRRPRADAADGRPGRCAADRRACHGAAGPGADSAVQLGDRPGSGWRADRPGRAATAGSTAWWSRRGRDRARRAAGGPRPISPFGSVVPTCRSEPPLEALARCRGVPR